jgi:hypothetical protein
MSAYVATDSDFRLAKVELTSTAPRIADD